MIAALGKGLPFSHESHGGGGGLSAEDLCECEYSPQWRPPGFALFA